VNKAFRDQETQKRSIDSDNVVYDRGTIKVVFFACFIIVLAVVLTGGISYFITRNAVVDKLKSRDLIYVVESMTAKIDGRIERAKETSLLLAQDPTIIHWIAGGESDERLGELAKKKITDIAQNYDYANSFIVSAVTNHYWAEGAKMLQVMSQADPNAKWFYEALKSGQAVDLNIDYNSGRKDTFVFINALVGEKTKPIAVAGVGLSLKEISREFQSYKTGEKSNLWLVDSKGKIHLADDAAHNGRYLNEFVPEDVVNQIIHEKSSESSRPTVIEYTDQSGEAVDLAYQSTKSTSWKLVFQLPRSESIAILGNIKFNAAVASLISLMLMIFVFYVVSRRIANPLKRAVAIAREMEKQVEERTRELAEKNQNIMDSIDYAKRLQESILPSAEDLQAVFRQHFVLWRPRDTVGGDFYWVRNNDADKLVVAVVDCTGHGVPGAFMTMAVNSILNHIVDEKVEDPADILKELNRRVKETLHRNDQSRITDDGLDIGICCVERNNKKLTFAGAKIPLYVKRGQQVYVIKGNNRSIGYRRSNRDMDFTNHVWEIEENDVFYLSTDGYIDQNGGTRDYPLGRKRFIQIIENLVAEHMPEQKEEFIRELNGYMGYEPQRDDITVIGLSF